MMLTLDKVRDKLTTWDIWESLQLNRHLGLLDLALIVSAVFMFLGSQKIFLFHVIFILLTLGAFFWDFRAFAWRTAIWVEVTIAGLMVGIYQNEIPPVELIEIPLMAIILLLVFAIARQRAKALEAKNQALQDLSTLLEISRNVVLTDELKPLLVMILDHLKNLVDYDTATIYKLEEGILTALVRRGGGSREEITRLHFVVDRTVLGEIQSSKQKLAIIPDLWADTAQTRSFRQMIGDQLEIVCGQNRCWVGISLVAKDRVIGILALQHRQPNYHYTPNQADLLLGFANQAALAIESARHYEQGQTMAALEERQRLANDLHDAVSQTLFSANLSAEVLPRLWERNPSEAQRCLAEIHLLTRTALAEMRTLLLELRPGALIEVELKDLLEQLVKAIGSRMRLPVTLTGEKFGPLPPKVQIALYRIAQEALNNIVKHAGASQATVEIHSDTPPNHPDCRAVELRILDNGRGFDPQSVSATSFGLDIMRERAEAVGAELTVISRFGQGTQVIVAWPATHTQPNNDPALSVQMR